MSYGDLFSSIGTGIETGFESIVKNIVGGAGAAAVGATKSAAGGAAVSATGASIAAGSVQSAGAFTATVPQGYIAVAGGGYAVAPGYALVNGQPVLVGGGVSRAGNSNNLLLLAVAGVALYLLLKK